MNNERNCIIKKEFSLKYVVDVTQHFYKWIAVKHIILSRQCWKVKVQILSEKSQISMSTMTLVKMWKWWNHEKIWPILTQLTMLKWEAIIQLWGVEFCLKATRLSSRFTIKKCHEIHAKAFKSEILMSKVNFGPLWKC